MCVLVFQWEVFTWWRLRITGISEMSVFFPSVLGIMKDINNLVFKFMKKDFLYLLYEPM